VVEIHRLRLALSRDAMSANLCQIRPDRGRNLPHCWQRPANVTGRPDTSKSWISRGGHGTGELPLHVSA